MYVLISMEDPMYSSLGKKLIESLCSFTIEVSLALSEKNNTCSCLERRESFPCIVNFISIKKD